MRRLVFAVACLAGFAFSAPAWAVDGDALAKFLVKKGILTQADLNELQAELVKEQKAQDARVEQIASKASGLPDWVARTKWKGDIRLRDEFRDRENTTDGHRQRVRFRYGFTNDVNDQLQVGARFVTGTNTDTRNSSGTQTGDVVSTNQTLDDTWARKNWNLDRAYVRYTPEVAGLDQLRLWGGFFGNPFVGGKDFIWDGDLSWAGAAVQAKQSLSPTEVFFNAGIFPIDSDAFPNEWVGLYGVQGGVSLQPFEYNEAEALDNLKLTSALGYFDYKNAVKAKTAPILTKSGNSAEAEDFNELHFHNQAATKIADLPVKIWGDWVHNTSATVDADGFQFGFKVGKAKKPFDLKEGWEAGYYFERLESEAAFDAFVDSDFGGGGTNHKGNVYFAKMAVLKNSTFGIEYDVAEEVDGAKNKEDRIQFDWITKF